MCGGYGALNTRCMVGFGKYLKKRKEKRKLIQNRVALREDSATNSSRNKNNNNNKDIKLS